MPKPIHTCLICGEDLPRSRGEDIYCRECEQKEKRQHNDAIRFVEVEPDYEVDDVI